MAKATTLSTFDVDLNSDLLESSNSTLATGYDRLMSRRAELEEHSSQVRLLLRDLEDDVDDLRVQEGWDGPTAAGAHDWATDPSMVFRALRVSTSDSTPPPTRLVCAIH
jgi:hypothetical protein